MMAIVLLSGATAAVSETPHGPNRQQSIENENKRMKAAKERADAAKAAELEAQKKAEKARAEGATPAGAEAPK